MNLSVNRVGSAGSLVVMALALGGCQVLGIGQQRVARASLDASPSVIASFGSDQLEAGRTALKEGRTVAAIDAFMIAKSFEGQAPAAYNGLAIAYSRLGREDLAERFFQEAVTLAPEETKYRSNLATFYSRHGMPRMNTPALAIAPVEPVVDAAPVLAMASTVIEREARVETFSRVTARAPASGLQRVSRHEVKIVGSTRRVIVEVGGSTTAAQPQNVRVAIGGGRTPLRAARPAYPVRVDIGDR
jgi:tetratricopeptide (TPR) repeat protein